MGERWHSYIHRVSEQRHRNFPRFGHYDTWVIDELQLLVERNHNVHLYRGWSNTADFCDTTERFDTVPLHSPSLAEAMRCINLPSNATSKFTADQQYLCARMGTLAPLLPVHGKEECALSFFFPSFPPFLPLPTFCKKSRPAPKPM